MSKYIGVPVDLLGRPREGDTLVDRVWVVQDGRALFFQGNGSKGWAAQCNHDERLVDRLIAARHPNAEAKEIPVAYLGRWDENWGHMLSADLLEASVEMEA